MKQRNRKLVGTLLTLLMLVAYCAGAILIYDLLPVETPMWATLIFFVVAGLGWVFPATAVIRWMAKQDEVSR